MSNHFTDSLYESLLITQEIIKKTEEVNGYGNPPLKNDLPELLRLNETHPGVEDFYRKMNNGWQKEWKKEKNSSVGGNIKLAEAENLFADSKSFGLYDEATAENADIRFFHPFDYPSSESYVGFVIRPDTIYKSVYYMSISDYELYNLDLDFNGYTEMAIEARVFNHWQKILLYYMGDAETGSSETETFKTEMPKIFPGWTWDNFIDKFESLRLSNK